MGTSKVIACLSLISLALASCNSAEPTKTILLFTKTDGYRHSTIELGRSVIEEIALTYGYRLQATEDSSRLENALSSVDLVLFLHTTGELLSDSEQRSLRSFVESGGGYAGIHAASDAEYDWPWYGYLG